MQISTFNTLLMTGAAVIALASATQAPASEDDQASAPIATATADLEEIVVVGSQIAGARTTAAVPVTLVDQRQIEAIGVSSGDELFRSIPQLGDVAFNSINVANSSNFSRGDVGSVNLRNLGIGNTLVLLNGRRMVTYPNSQRDENNAPVLTANANAIPVTGVSRVEVLRDGAAALYGTDAVGGVINTVLKSDYKGLQAEVQYGAAEGTKMSDLDANILAGRDFGGGRGNITLFYNYTHRTALKSDDLGYTASTDKRPLFVGTAFENNPTLDRRNVLSPWGDFQTPAAFGTVRQNAVVLTTSTGAFHIQPSSFAGCQTQLPGGICIDDGARATSGADRDLRWDGQANWPIHVVPRLTRHNLFLSGQYELTEGVTAFGEIGYYDATTHSIQDSVFTIGAIRMTVPASNYYNPFGPTVFANGQVNPNRLPGLNIPAAGLPVTIINYRFSDMGPTAVDVSSYQTRFLGGLRGKFAGFNWESAALYSRARVTDVQDAISATILQQQLALSTPDAYNPFNGGNIADTDGRDTTPSSAAAINPFRIKGTRQDTSTLMLADFKVSRPDLFELPGGSVGVAFGAEARRETQRDDRDKRLDGTMTWTDTVTGVVQPSDNFGVAQTADTYGKRSVVSAYAELAVPIVSPEMGIPLVHRLEAQLAGRYEHYSDFGSVAKPKVAVAWDLFDGLRLRGSWSEGFRAPNLEQINQAISQVGSTQLDYAFCEADRRAGRITSFVNCTRSIVATAVRQGNKDLQPEESTSKSVGVVFQPRFVPEQFGAWTLTADYWEVSQTGIVGLFGERNALIRDYFLRKTGTTDGTINRAAPTAEDIAAFAGTGLTPAGQVINVSDKFVNLLPQNVRGLDVGVTGRFVTETIGTIDLNANVARTLEFFRDAPPELQALMDAQKAGQIDPSIALTGAGNLLQQNGRPKWKVSGSVNWSYGPFGVNAFAQYTGKVKDTSLVAADGTVWTVEDQTTVNLSATYDVPGEGVVANTQLRVGVRNLFDKDPPLAAGTYGYLAALYQPYARYWYVRVRKTF